MTRWQYRIVNLGAFNAAQRLGMALAYFGERGWELTVVYDKASNWLAEMEKGFMIFKRPVPQGAEPDGPWTEFWNAEQVDHVYQEAKKSQ